LKPNLVASIQNSSLEEVPVSYLPKIYQISDGFDDNEKRSQSEVNLQSTKYHFNELEYMD
jgi:hypothetical protein